MSTTWNAFLQQHGGMGYNMQELSAAYRQVRQRAREQSAGSDRSITARRGAKEFFSNTGKSAISAIKSPVKALKRAGRTFVVGSNVLLTHQAHDTRNKSYQNFEKVMSPKELRTAMGQAIRHPIKVIRRLPKAIAASANYATQFHQKAR